MASNIFRVNAVNEALLAFFRRLERRDFAERMVCQFCHDSLHKPTCELKALIDVLEVHKHEMVTFTFNARVR